MQVINDIRDNGVDSIVDHILQLLGCEIDSYIRYSLTWLPIRSAWIFTQINSICSSEILIAF